MAGQPVSKITKIEDVKPGDITGRDVINAKGQLILRKGAELTPGLIDQLKRFGLGHIHIEKENEGDEKDQESSSEEKLHEISARLERQFSHALPLSRTMAGLKEIFRDYHRDKIGNGQN